MKWPNKDPDDILDYGINWAARLGTDTISASTWIVEDGITQDSASFTDTTTAIWLSGGTAGVTYDITNRIVTAAGRQIDQTVSIAVLQM